jgi:hypothetical protein
MDTSSLIDLARSELLRGNKKRVREYLRIAIAQNKLNEEAWLLFADAAESKTDEYTCLNNVIKINPNNLIATQRLQSFILSLPPPKEKQIITNKNIIILAGAITLTIICMCFVSSASIYFIERPNIQQFYSLPSPTYLKIISTQPPVENTDEDEGMLAINTVKNYTVGGGMKMTEGIGLVLTIYINEGHEIDTSTFRWTYQKNNSLSYIVRFYFIADGSEENAEWLCSNVGIVTPRNDWASAFMAE